MFKLDGENAVQLARAMAGGSSRPRASTIACSECDSMMVYPEPGIIHNDPPRKRLKCLQCGLKSWEEVEDPGPTIDITDRLMKKGAKGSPEAE